MTHASCQNLSGDFFAEILQNLRSFRSGCRPFRIQRTVISPADQAAAHSPLQSRHRILANRQNNPRIPI